MLGTLRKYATGFVAQIFILLLVLSFGVWGISDIFRGFGVGEIARVGDTPISVEQFQRSYQRQVQALSRQVQQPITPDQARLFGIPEQVLGQLVTEASLADRAKAFGLGISDQKLSSIITSDPAFFAGGQRFDRAYFTQLIGSSGFTEAQYLQARRNAEIRDQIAESISGGLKAPEAYRRALHEYQAETRKISYLVLDASKVPDTGQPSETQLMEYFEAHKEQWRAPEFRSLAILKVEPSDISRPEDVTDEVAKADYEANRASYGEPEQRRVIQVVFGDRAEADAAAAQITGGATLESIAASRGLAPQEFELGLVSRNVIVDPVVADTAFTLANGATSGVVEGRFGPVIVKVTEIVPEAVRPYEEMAAEIKKAIADRQAVTRIIDEHDRIEDARAGGASIAEVGQTLNLPIITVAAVDREGNGPDGQTVANIPGDADLLSQAFEADIGLETDVVQLSQGGFAWFEVTKIDPARERTLDEVRAQVIEAWREERTNEALAAEAEKVAESLRSGTPIAEVAAANGIAVQTREGLTRQSEADPNLPAAAAQAVFTVPNGQVVVTPGENSVVVAKVDNVTIPPYMPGSVDSAETDRQLSASLGNDLLQQYIEELQLALGVSVNQSLVQQVIGQSTF